MDKIHVLYFLLEWENPFQENARKVHRYVLYLRKMKVFTNLILKTRDAVTNSAYKPMYTTYNSSKSQKNITSI